MTEDELDLLVRSWIDYHARAWAAESGVEQQAPDHNDEAFWAVDELVDICRTDFDLCWKVICRIMEMHSGDATMASLAAGPLEYLLTTHGEEVIDRLEARARQDADFRRLLGGVWRQGIPDAIWYRIEALREEPPLAQ